MSLYLGSNGCSTSKGTTREHEEPGEDPLVACEVVGQLGVGEDVARYYSSPGTGTLSLTSTSSNTCPVVRYRLADDVNEGQNPRSNPFDTRCKIVSG